MAEERFRLNINQWAEEDRPREKMMMHGAAALSDAELLAILIGSGSREETAVGLMKRVLHDCNNNLNTLGKKSVSELSEYKGLGPAKAISILAACELGKRRQGQDAEERPNMGSPENIYEYMRPRMQDLDVEEAWILLMNQNYRLIKSKCISHGGLSETSVDVRVIMKEALMCNATVLALCHNHPSNNPTASINDDKITACVKKACDTMRIFFLDHLIVTDGNYYSYREQDKL